ncbi:toll/interleukin-1 receptor domain-containing protein [Actinokineospora sp. UTMC 2448]|uniref:toll/interleukin-1 receptor domain-containing protein n=1 Tax=Actinokineospora sp. UTMC 2448 TaxID=2268449 RepID=UPI002164CAFE|nr:toll/interleukin-1 receptor domain-containing protein [Actinokineospora sp. UTMC 2448]
MSSNAPFDVFICYSGDDRARVTEIRDALVDARLRVFMDSDPDSIRFAHSISSEIENGLRGAKTILLYYSASFPSRTACQFELHHAYLSALRRDEVHQRVLVVNPEDPETGHLLPLAAQANRYHRPCVSGADLKNLARWVRAAADGVTGPFADIDFSRRVRTRQTTAHGRSRAFVGRHRELWALHAALHRSDEPLITRSTAAPVAGLSGLAGIGKSSIARVYIHDFGFLYPGGSHWISLAGATPATIASVHGDELIALARTFDSPAPTNSAEARAWWDNRLANAGGPTLWVVDDVPPGLDADVLRQLIPSAPGVHTVLIGGHEFPREVAAPARVGPMTADNGHELFLSDRAADPDDADAIDDIVRGLGGHPQAILLAAAAADGRAGLWRLRERAAVLTADAARIEVVEQTLRALGPTERTVLALAAVCAARPLPAPLIRDVVAALAPADLARLNAVLTGLERANLIDADGTAWRVHQVVREACLRITENSSLDTVAAVAAHAVLALTERGEAGMVEHGAALLDRVAGSPTYAIGLNELASRHHTLRGEPLAAAPFYENLHSLCPDDPVHLVHAAQARQAAGQLDQADAHVEVLATAGDPLARWHGQRIQAAVLDDRGRHREAKELWSAVVTDPLMGRVRVEEKISARTGRLRNLRILADYPTARALAHDLLADITDATLADALVPARLELAAIGISTGDADDARAAAKSVMDHYQERGLPGHRDAVEATVLFYESMFDVFIADSIPDRPTLLAAAAELRREWNRARKTFGARNPRTLVIAVTHLRALIGASSSAEAIEVHTGLPAQLAEHLGPDHRLRARALFLLGWAYANLDRHDEAAAFHREAREHQLSVLGPDHPETLQTIYELGVADLRRGDRVQAKAAFKHVISRAADSVGTRTNLYGKAMCADALANLPSPVYHGFAALERLLRRR